MIIPRVFYHPSIVKLINHYIDLGFTSFDSLDDLDQEKLAMQCLKITGSDSLTELTDETCLKHLINYMDTYDTDYAYQLIVHMKSKAVDYFNHNISMLFEEELENHKNLIRREGGLSKIIDRINGEIRWV